jgi:hypothetical protein
MVTPEKFLAMMDTTSHSHRNSLPVRWFITSLLSPCSYLSGQEDEAQFPGLSHSPDLTPLDFFGVLVKYIINQENVRNVNELSEGIVRAAECVITEMLANAW